MILINKETGEIDPNFIFEDDIIGTLIKDFPDYIVYTDGTIFSIKRNIYLQPGLSKKGYLHVSLSNKNGRKTLKPHRLVAEHFIPNPNNYKEVDHKDRDKRNNDILNLRWVTRSDNTQNVGMRIDNKSGIKNIFYDKRGNRWIYQKKINCNRFSFSNKNKNICIWLKFAHYMLNKISILKTTNSEILPLYPIQTLSQQFH